MKQSYPTATNTKQQFNEVINYLLTSSNQDCLATLNFVRKKVKQFHLGCDIYVVMSDVYLRGIKFIENGGEIKRPLSWIKATALNVIREMSRRQKKITVDSSLLEAYLDTTVVEPDAEEAFGAAEWIKLQSALVKLRPDDQNILNLRWVKGLSWKEIAQSLSKDGQQMQEGTARKRGGRAFNRLREQYGALYLSQTNS